MFPLILYSILFPHFFGFSLAQVTTAKLRPSRTGEPHRFGGANVSANSYVYVGGLPAWYATKLSNLALPSVVFEPRFRGAVR